MAKIGLTPCDREPDALKNQKVYPVRNVVRRIKTGTPKSVVEEIVVLDYDDTSILEYKEPEGPDTLILGTESRATSSGTKYDQVHIRWNGKYWSMVESQKLELLDIFSGIAAENAAELRNLLMENDANDSLGD